MDGDISNLAGRVPLGRPEGPRSGEDKVQMEGHRWPPFWAVMFVISTGLLSWGAIAAVVVAVIN